MKFIRFGDGKTGLVVETPTGPHVVDLIESLRVLVPGDPISLGVLNGLFKDNGSWAPLIQHWQVARIGLIRLARVARIEGSGVVLRPLDETRIDSQPISADGITSIEITEMEPVSRDPTGREVMERQFLEQQPQAQQVGAPATPL